MRRFGCSRWRDARTLEALIEARLRRDNAFLPSGEDGERLVVFTEYLATLDYITARLQARFGEGAWLVQLFGGMKDEQRDEVKRKFNDAEGPARILLATDAAGEGLNLQRACRLMLHWDIPWNPGKMEQRNGRLDRHGQARDVFIFHFDSTDDATMRFLGKVLAKRSRTREDRIVTDEIFARALVAHFDNDEKVEESEERLDRAIKNAGAVQGDIAGDMPDGPPLPGGDDQARLEAVRAELDLSAESLRETLETALALDAGRPRLKADGPGRFRFVPVPRQGPVPSSWQDVVDQTLRDGGREGPLCALVFDPEHFVHLSSGRPVFQPERDARLLHLGHALYHRVMSTFARYRFPGGPEAATRWCLRGADLAPDEDALILLTLEELAVNDLREPCHHWVSTVALPVRKGMLGDPLPHQPPTRWGSARAINGDSLEVARRLWEDVEDPVKAFVETEQHSRTRDLVERMAAAGKRVTDDQRGRFKTRRKELEKAMSDNTLAKLERDIARDLKQLEQLSLPGFDDEKRRQLADKQVELALRKNHYESVLHRLAGEEKRTLDQVLPPRYRLRGEARVYPIAVELRLSDRLA